jgi:hypothetical protein
MKVARNRGAKARNAVPTLEVTTIGSIELRC